MLLLVLIILNLLLFSLIGFILDNVFNSSHKIAQKVTLQNFNPYFFTFFIKICYKFLGTDHAKKIYIFYSCHHFFHHHSFSFFFFCLLTLRQFVKKNFFTKPGVELAAYILNSCLAEYYVFKIP